MPISPLQQHQAALRSMSRVVEETATPTRPAAALRRVAGFLARGEVAVLTGAGVSTDSGIPDYRGPHGSLKRHRPMTYQEFRFDPEASHRYWARSFVGWREMARARPNHNHFAIAELERAGLLRGVVTQNVDGLHRAAGTKNLVPIHGDLDTVVCLDCGATEERAGLDGRLAAANPGYLERVRWDATAVNPDGDVALSAQDVAAFRMVGCLRCGSLLLKPDVVYFGESVPRQRRDRAAGIVAGASALLVAGSSLAVMSGYRLVIQAQRRGLPVAVIGGGPSRADGRAEVVWRTQVGPAFDQILDALEL